MPRPAPLALTVLRTERLTENLVRVVFGGPNFDRFVNNEFTDRYVKLVFPKPGVAYPEPFDVGVIRQELPQEQWPTQRTYTVRYHDPATRELAVDFVLHGDEGVAGPWAAHAQPGDELLVSGPGGAYAPRADVDWHLLVADESAFPAVASALEAMPDGAPVVAVLEVGSDAGRLEFETHAAVEIHWVQRDHSQADAAEPLVDAVRSLTFPDGRVQAFVHGELGAMRVMREHLLRERALPSDLVSISGYWRRGKDEDGFQAEKREEAGRT